MHSTVAELQYASQLSYRAAMFNISTLPSHKIIEWQIHA